MSLLQAEAAAPVGVCGPSSEGGRRTGGPGDMGGPEDAEMNPGCLADLRSLNSRGG